MEGADEAAAKQEAEVRMMEEANRVESEREVLLKKLEDARMESESLKKESESVKKEGEEKLRAMAAAQTEATNLYDT